MTRKHSKATWQCDSTWWPTLELWKWCHAPNDQILKQFATNQKMHIWMKYKLDSKKYLKSDVEKYKHCQRHNGPRHCFYNLIYLSSYKANSVERKTQVKHSIGSNFGQMTLPALVPNLPTRWRHHLVNKFVPNSSYRSNAWVRCASGNVWQAHGTFTLQFKIWSWDAVTYIFGHQMTPLAWVAKLATWWHHSHWFQIWPPDFANCISCKFDHQMAPQRTRFVLTVS